ncbi:MAG: hypothetical protein SX243_18735 [Acidobacteriota bacterium]|nr:hypothetical protein [Acidobacteriota bacterium]
MLSEPIRIVAQVAEVLDTLGVRYLVGGSLATSIYGVPRATQDVDLVAEITASQAEPLARLLGSDFYVDVDRILDAVRRRASFNVIHLATMFKADVFVMKDDAWSREEMGRARSETLRTPDGPVVIRFATPEDTLLHKLVWYRLGNEISDRQWGDILGVFKVQGGLLDNEYLDRWAPTLEVADLLTRARSQAEG